MNEVFVDTSAFYAFLVANDRCHDRAREALTRLGEGNAALITSSLVLQETVALLQARVGISAVRSFHYSVAPALEVVWIEDQLYHRSMAALISADSRSVSLTDWSSFEVMRSRGLKRAFTFDRHFETQGFIQIPA